MVAVWKFRSELIRLPCYDVAQLADIIQADAEIGIFGRRVERMAGYFASV